MSAALHKRTLAIALPMIVSNLSVPMVGMVDTAVAGHLPDVAYLAAVAVGATIFNFLFLGLNFLRMGTTGLTAQAHGRGDFSAARSVLAQALLLALGLATVLLILQWPLRELAVVLMAPGEQVAGYVRNYFTVRIWSAPMVLANYALIGWFLGMQTAKAPLAMMLTINLVNAGLDVAFVYGLGMRVEGIALASVCGETAGLIAGSWLAYRVLRAYPAAWKARRLRDLRSWLELITVNGNILIRTLCLMVSFALFTALGARLGVVVLAANALLLNLQSILSYGLDGFAHAAEAIAGRAWGQRALAAFRAAVNTVLIWSLGIAGGFTLLYWLAGRGLINLLTDLPDVRAAAYAFLPWMVLSPLVSVWSFVYDGVFIGATWAREMRNAMLIATFGVFVPLSIWLINLWGNHGLWLAFLVFLGARGVTMAGWYRWRVQRSAFACPAVSSTAREDFKAGHKAGG